MPRICSRPGCPNISQSSYCANHERPNSSARGYGSDHRKRRAAIAPDVQAGRINCWRCGRRIEAGQPFDLGHIEPGEYGGPEHIECNRSAAGKDAQPN